MEKIIETDFLKVIKWIKYNKRKNKIFNFNILQELFTKFWSIINILKDIEEQ